MLRTPKLIVLIALWILVVGAGLHALMTYKGVPGSDGATPHVWPRNKLIEAPSGKPLLVMFAHPRCPCTKASLGELELLVAQAKDKFDATVLFYEPAEGSGEWSDTASIQAARAIPGVRVVTDREGTLAQTFAAKTSGQTVVYSPAGKLLFTGGITGSRGHMGDNQGFDSVLTLFTSEPGTSAAAKTKVFGCGLFDECKSPQTVQN